MPTVISGSTGVDKIQDGTVQTADIASGALYGESAVNTTVGGTTIEFTGLIPSWANEFTVHHIGLSTNGTSGFAFQVGVAGVYITTGYSSLAHGYTTTAVSTSTQTTSIPNANALLAASVYDGFITFKRVSGNKWTAFGSCAGTGNTGGLGVGSIDAGGVIDSVRWTTVAGTNTVDGNAGMNVTWRL